METTAYYAFGVPLYAALIVFERWRGRRRGHAVMSFAPSVGNIAAGLGAITVGLALGPALIALYDWALARFAIVRWQGSEWWLWLIALVLADFGHYWHHRLDHRVAACWAVHGVHHMPEEMNFTVGMRHAWFSDLYSWPFYAPLPLLGVPTGHFFIATTMLSVHALLTHTAELDFPGFGVLVTPRSHLVHHCKNARYVDKNFGAMLCVWDRLFGTHVALDPAEPPRYGLAHGGYDTHDGVRAQWSLWARLSSELRRAKSGWQRLELLFGRPSQAAPAPAPRLPAPSRRTRITVSVQLAATIAFSLYVFVFRAQHSLALLTLGAAAIIASLMRAGTLLDGRRHM